MWKLTVKRTHDKTYRDGTKYTLEDELVFKSETINDLEIIVEDMEKYACDGEYTYTIVRGKGEQE